MSENLSGSSQVELQVINRSHGEDLTTYKDRVQCSLI